MPLDLRNLTDSVVAITGASTGIGAATARLLVEAGARVAVQARHPERLEALADQFGPDRVAVVVGDVRDPGAAAALVAGAVHTFGRLDSMVANAGIGMYGGILDAGDDELQRMMRTNVEGTVWAVRAAVRQFRSVPDAGGDVVIVSSVAGLRGDGNEAVYAATKFAQVGLGGALDREVRPEGIRVTTICPAAVNTEFALGAGRTEGDPGLEEYLRPEDVGQAIVTVLQQPRRLRTTQWQLWSMSQG